MAFPTVIGRRETETGNASSFPAMLVDGSNVAGRLALIIVSIDGGATVTWPAGWTELFDSANGTEVTLAAGYRVIDGTEGFDGTDDGITLTPSATEASAVMAFLISGHDSAIAPSVSAAATGSSSAPNSASLTPAGGAKDYLWITAFALDVGGTEGTHTQPTNYSNIQDAVSVTGANGNGVATAERELNAATEDPGAWTSGWSDGWVARTIAIHPGAPSVFGEVTMPIAMTMAVEGFTMLFGEVTMPIAMTMNMVGKTVASFGTIEVSDESLTKLSIEDFQIV